MVAYGLRNLWYGELCVEGVWSIEFLLIRFFTEWGLASCQRYLLSGCLAFWEEKVFILA